jgi:transposase
MYEAKIVRKSLQQTIKQMDSQIEKTKKEIGKVIEKDPVLSKKAASMTSVKGISILSVASIIAETNGFELFNSQKQLTSYAGYDVVENQSGNKAGKTRISKKGNKHIRRSMYFPALNVIRYKVEPFYGLYQRVFERTKCKMKAITAVQRKLLIIMYTLWKSEQPFNSKFQDTSGNHEPKHPSFRVISPKGLINKQPLIAMSGCSRWTSVQTIA